MTDQDVGGSSSEVTFVVNPETEAASVGLLLNSLEHINRLLRDVDYAIYGAKSQHKWVIRKLQSSAPSITVQPEISNGHGLQAVEVISGGLRAVTVGTDHPPQFFTEQALVNLGKMRRLFSGKNRAKSITVLRDREQMATIKRDISEKTNRILTAGYHNLGSLEGTLEAINVHGTPTVTIWDRVNRSPVRCSIPKDAEWLSIVTSLLEKRVLVTGNIHYFVNGTPRSIANVTAIEDATADPNLPRADFGSIPDARAATDPAAFLQSVRGSAVR